MRGARDAHDERSPCCRWARRACSDERSTGHRGVRTCGRGMEGGPARTRYGRPGAWSARSSRALPSRWSASDGRRAIRWPTGCGRSGRSRSVPGSRGSPPVTTMPPDAVPLRTLPATTASAPATRMPVIVASTSLSVTVALTPVVEADAGPALADDVAPDDRRSSVPPMQIAGPSNQDTSLPSIVGAAPWPTPIAQSVRVRTTDRVVADDRAAGRARDQRARPRGRCARWWASRARRRRGRPRRSRR